MAAGNRGKMGDQNLVTGKHLSEEILTDLRGGPETASPIQLTPADPPYYFMRIDGTRRLRDQAFPGGPTAPVSIAGWRQVRVKPGRLLEELHFLEGLGLAMVRPNSSGEVYLVSPLSSVLYAQGTGPVREENEGVFIRINTNRPEKALKFIHLLRTYVLPGMFWRNYYVTDGLAPDLHLTSRLGSEMLEIGDFWDHLARKFGWPPAI